MILNNFLSKYYAEEIKREMLSYNFPWHYAERTIEDYVRDGCVDLVNHKDTPYFQHIIQKGHQKSNYFGLFNPMLLFFEHRTNFRINNIVRIVANLMLPNEVSISGIPHIDTSSDLPEKVKTLLYYVNETDGNTTLFEERFSKLKKETLTVKSIETPEFNKAILFESDRYHCSGTPTKDRRIVINLILELE